ncbi:MAG: AMP-binding protein [Betaproteobacteria bacterium]
MTARLVFGTRDISPAQFDEAVQRAAAGLEQAGVGEGDVACIMLKNEPAFLVAALAARLIGAYSCPINWHYKAEEAGWILRDSGAKLLFTSAELRSQIADGIPTGLAVIEHPEEWAASHAPWRGHARPPRMSMPYTSGTTGRAKGVRRHPLEASQAQKYRQCLASALGIEQGMRALLSAPLYHSAPAGYGIQAMLNAELFVLEEKFDAERALALIEQHRLTHAYLVPTMYVRLLRLPEETRNKYDLRTLRFVASTGAPCPAQVKRAMIDWLGPRFHEAYAASEFGYVTAITAEEALRKPGSAGRPIGDAVVRILDRDGRELPRGEVGLIYVRQPAFPDFVYNNNPEARRALERDGLCAVGDMGWLDADGYLYVSDRASDMVISGGVNIYPAEIEAALAMMPGVRDCAVFGIPDEEFGEALCAALQLEPGVKLSAGEVQAFLKERISGFKVPKRIEFHAELPREESGKIFKRRLRAPHWAKAGRNI